MHKLNKKTMTYVLLTFLLIGVFASLSANNAFDEPYTHVQARVETIEEGDKLYFSPNDQWKNDNARFAARFYSGTIENDADQTAWQSLFPVEGKSNLYYLRYQSGTNAQRVKFTRMNPASNGVNTIGWQWDATGLLSRDVLTETHYDLTGTAFLSGSGNTLWKNLYQNEADTYANSFLTSVGGTCDPTGAVNNISQQIWNQQSVNFSLLENGSKQFMSTGSTEFVNNAKALHNYIVNKYNYTPLLTYTPPTTANLTVATEAFNGTATTSVRDIGVALYYDVKENGLPVPADRITYKVSPATASFTYFPRLNQYYLRATATGTYTVTMKAYDKDDNAISRTHSITVNYDSSELTRQSFVANIYPNNISAAQLDYRNNAVEAVKDSYVIVGKNFTVFQRINFTGNYATSFIPFSRFDGGQRLEDFTISFKYTSLNAVWKLVFSMWTGPTGGDDYSADYLRLLVHNNQIGIQGDTQENSAYKDLGEATNIPLKEGPVWVKFVRDVTEISSGNFTVVFKLYTSTNGVNFVNNTTATLTNQVNTAGGRAALLWGFVPFSIDNDFIIEDMAVTGSLFTL